MTTQPKRLIEVSLPLKPISARARREKSIRHGHISTLHLFMVGAAAAGRLPGRALRRPLARPCSFIGCVLAKQ